MGQFSWLDCETEEQIVDNKKRDVFVLVPKEFQDTYGKNIKETCYDGYGHFGGHDIFDLVAIWNKDHIGKENISVPTRESFGDGEVGERYYQNALKNYEMKCNRIEDFVKGTPFEEMDKKYGWNGSRDWLREIGIDIACYDKQNANLEYPIKITHYSNSEYEKCEPSLSDPNQGWEEEEEEEYDEDDYDYEDEEEDEEEYNDYE